MSMIPSSHLDSLIQQPDLKFVFVGGKGGVGKTTSSSAIATLFAKYGRRRTLLVSTDPAHSLGDAFRTTFSNTPTSPSAETLPNLHVMEIDPSVSMQSHLAEWASLAADLAGDGTSTETQDKIGSFQSWLSGIPGIDEATALSQAITHIESGEYDVIVFDTAPTGHTLKLLALPDILQAGITKLESWQTTLYGYWDAMKGLASTGNTAESRKRATAKEEIAKKLSDYKRDIQKVSFMLQDQMRTRFVVVCIAEYLSISETKRLLQELRINRVKASHVVVNQLVTQDALTKEQLEELEALAEVGNLNLNQELLQRTVHACRLTTSRKVIQTKYLNELKNSAEAVDLDGLCEVPLLAEEVTGMEALSRFASLLVETESALGDDDHHNGVVASASSSSSSTTGAPPQALYDDQLSAMDTTEETTTTSSSSSTTWTPTRGDTVKVQHLAKSAQYNELDGTIVSNLSEETGRYGVEIQYQDKRKVLALQLKNIRLVQQKKQKKTDSNSNTSTNNNTTTTNNNPMESKIAKLLEDPEVKELIAKNPKFEAAVKDCMVSPMNALQYMSDPEMSPLVSKIMAKMM